MKVIIEYQDQFGRWRRYGESHHEASAYRSAAAKASSTGKRFRLIDGNGNLLDIINP